MDAQGSDSTVRWPARLRRLAGWGIGLMLGALCVVIALSIYDEFAFRHQVSVMDRRMKGVGGGFSNGRREYSRHVTAWAHDRSVTDADVTAIAAVLRDWHVGGWSDELALNLSGTSISDAGLAPLRDLRSLKSLDLTGTKVTASGVEGIRRGSPGLEIRYSHDSPSP